MQWVQVDSSAVSKIAYQDGELYIEWKTPTGGEVYAYRAPESEFLALSGMSEGIGAYCNRVIKRYSVRHVGHS